MRICSSIRYRLSSSQSPAGVNRRWACAASLSSRLARSITASFALRRASSRSALRCALSRCACASTRPCRSICSALNSCARRGCSWTSPAGADSTRAARPRRMAKLRRTVSPRRLRMDITRPSPSAAEFDQYAMQLAVVAQRDYPGFTLERPAVEFPARDTAAGTVGIGDLDRVAAAAVAILDREPRPVARDARIQPQVTAPQVEAEDRLEAGPVQPGAGAGVPGPATAADVWLDRVHVRGRDVGLDLVARHAFRRGRVVDGVDQREQFERPVAVAHPREGEDRPLRAVRVLAAVLAQAGRIGLDVAGVVVGMLERRREQQRELP